jgi:hypothetical protein
MHESLCYMGGRVIVMRYQLDFCILCIFRRSFFVYIFFIGLRPSALLIKFTLFVS